MMFSVFYYEFADFCVFQLIAGIFLCGAQIVRPLTNVYIFNINTSIGSKVVKETGTLLHSQDKLLPLSRRAIWQYISKALKIFIPFDLYSSITLKEIFSMKIIRDVDNNCTKILSLVNN